MTTRMLIDATHAEETRIVVLSGSRVETFDFESASKRQLKGNIYLAKVTRVEPSLQAAFIDYGGNRHGFLAFNEIHPDYYQIPVADRQALLEEEAQQAAQEAADDDAAAGEAAPDAMDAADGEEEAADAPPDVVGGGEASGADALDEVPRPRARSKHSYKIQEVIKRRQILLVQVVKEERGNKGAALTTYLSLAGRYCVLMPNTARGGGISRKIANQTARRKLKSIVGELDLPEGMGVIVRTAGMNRTKTEIKRDFEYLLRIWDDVRENTLKSTAPTLVYEEANLVKRAIRDYYTKDVDEILVDGEAGYRIAKEFMRAMQPSHSRKVQAYRGSIPLLQRFQVEQQLDQMHSNTVQLKSGGYIVLSPTEALVAIDVNSGRSTKEHNIEETALKTNLEASDEVARQLRLRDLAGLIVIDYIDMNESKHCRQVERRLKECLKVDRARIQVGRISSFGLLEMSRQRLRPSLFEASTVPCAVCGGTGHVRTTESTALHVLRVIEEEGIRNRADAITVTVPPAVSLYILNRKRKTLQEIEERYEMLVMVYDDAALVSPAYSIEVDEPRTEGKGYRPAPIEIEIEPEEEPEPFVDEDEETEEAEAEVEAEAAAEAEEDARPVRRRRRRRRRGEDDEHARAAPAVEADEAAAETTEAADEEHRDDERRAEGDEDTAPRRRRRGRRGGRRRRAAGDNGAEYGAAENGGAENGGAENRVERGTVDAESDTAAQEHEAPAEVAAEAVVAGFAPGGEAAPEATPEPDETAAAEAWEPAAAEPAEVEPEPAGEPETVMASSEQPEPVAEAEPETEPGPVPTALPLAAAAEDVAEVLPLAAAPAGKLDEAAAEPAAAIARPPPYTAGGDAAVIEADAESKVEEENRPKRRGWWQRHIG